MGTRAAVWLAWALAALSLLLCAASIALYVAAGSVQPPSNWGTGGHSAVLVLVVPFLAFPFVGALIASKRSKNPIGWICLAVGVIWMIMLTSTSYGSDRPTMSATNGCHNAVGKIFAGTGR